ncbi:antibiotic biosynthesis monooxygenase [Asanoa iriomotensis]
MYARSSTINARPALLDQGIAFLSGDLMHDLTAIDGCVGMSLLVDRETGRCVATSSWATEQAMRASESRVPPLRRRLLEAFGATEIKNEEWEVAFMHRDHRAPDGAYARVSYLRGDQARVDQSSEIFKSVLPAIEDAPGFCSASLLLNRESDQVVTNVIFDSAQSLARTAERAAALRTKAAGQMNAEIIEVAEFELAFAHLRVPELV